MINLFIEGVYMGIYNFLAKSFLLKGNDAVCRTDIQEKLRLLEKSQWLTHPELEYFQDRKLRSLILHSYHNVPYYHNLFRSLDLKRMI